MADTVTLLEITCGANRTIHIPVDEIEKLHPVDQTSGGPASPLMARQSVDQERVRKRMGQVGAG